MVPPHCSAHFGVGFVLIAHLHSRVGHPDRRQRLSVQDGAAHDRYNLQEGLYIHTPGWTMQIEGNGFLYKMVRHMIGAALTVGRGRMTVEQVETALLKGSNELPGASTVHPALYNNDTYVRFQYS